MGYGVFRTRTKGRVRRRRVLGYAATAPPTNVTPPVVSGTAVVTQTLSTTDGTWLQSPTSFTYQWQRDNAGGGVYANIAAATASTYTLVSADAGCQVRCRVTATNSFGSSSPAASNALTITARTPALHVEAAFGYGPADASPVWTDISSYVRTLRWQRGRQNELGTTEAGTGSLKIADRSSLFDANNPSAYAVKPGTPIRAYIYDGVVTYMLFSHFIERLPRTLRVTQVYTERQIDTIDGFALLASAGLGGYSYSAEASDVRVSNVLDDIAWPAASRSIGTGVSTIAAATYADGDDTRAQTHLLAVDQSENGFFFVNGSGYAVFIGRHQLITDAAYSAPAATFGDAQRSAGYPYTDLVPSYDWDQVYNRWTGTRSGATPQVWDDTVSQGEYLLRTKQIDSLVTTDGEVLSQIQWKAGQFAQPLNRVDSLTIMPLADLTNYTQQAAGLAREVAERITVLETPSGFASENSDDYVIQKVSGELSDGLIANCKLTFQLWPASTTSFWVAGDANQSLAGVSTKPGY